MSRRGEEALVGDAGRAPADPARRGARPQARDRRRRLAGVAFRHAARLGAAAMGELSSTEREAIERAAAEPMLDQVLAWSAINSGSRNLAGLERMAGAAGRRLRRAARRASRSRSRRRSKRSMPPAAPATIEHGRHLHLKVRPDAPVQLLLHRPHGHGVRRRPRVPGRRAGSRTACSTAPASPT